MRKRQLCIWKTSWRLEKRFAFSCNILLFPRIGSSLVWCSLTPWRRSIPAVNTGSYLAKFLSNLIATSVWCPFPLELWHLGWTWYRVYLSQVLSCIHWWLICCMHIHTLGCCVLALTLIREWLGKSGACLQLQIEGSGRYSRWSPLYSPAWWASLRKAVASGTHAWSRCICIDCLFGLVWFLGHIVSCAADIDTVALSIPGFTHLDTAHTLICSFTGLDELFELIDNGLRWVSLLHSLQFEQRILTWHILFLWWVNIVVVV